MKKLILAMAAVVAMAGVFQPKAVQAYNFGDYRSETLVTKAWEALNAGDMDAVMAYTNKTIELYGEEAKKMQAELKDYVAGEPKDKFAKWALNDVATAFFIQGEAYRKANMMDEAQAAYVKIIDNYKFGQTYDTRGWFWKPAEAAKEKLAAIKSGSNIDYGDYSSSYLTTQAWRALTSNDTDSVMAYTDKVIELYAEEAVKMQTSLSEYPWESKEKIFEYWALNDVGTSLFIRGEALKKAGKGKEAKQAYQKLVDNFFYAQTWDPQGWFWKPAEAAQQALDELSS